MVAGPGTIVISRPVGSRAKQTSMAKTEENWGYLRHVLAS